MAGFITLPQAIMSVVGGIPVQPAGPMTIIEKLRAAKSMLPGDISGILAKVLQEGPQALLQNPIASITGQLQGQLGGLVSQIQGLSGMGLGGLLSAISGTGGLQSALGNLTGVANSLSGLAGSGPFSLIDAIGHANIVGMLGSAMPANLSIANAMGPVLMGSGLNSMLGQVQGIASAITAGTIDPVAAVAQVTGMTSTINGVLDASAYAFSTVQNAVVGIAQTAGLISLVASGPADFGQIANMLIRDEMKPAIQAAMDEQIRPVDTPIDLGLGDDGDWGG
jgi:hypothetical protein